MNGLEEGEVQGGATILVTQSSEQPAEGESDLPIAIGSKSLHTFQGEPWWFDDRYDLCYVQAVRSSGIQEAFLPASIGL